LNWLQTHSFGFAHGSRLNHWHTLTRTPQAICQPYGNDNVFVLKHRC
jgi:hypothetical protein